MGYRERKLLYEREGKRRDGTDGVIVIVRCSVWFWWGEVKSWLCRGWVRVRYKCYFWNGLQDGGELGVRVAGASQGLVGGTTPGARERLSNQKVGRGIGLGMQVRRARKWKCIGWNQIK